MLKRGQIAGSPALLAAQALLVECREMRLLKLPSTAADVWSSRCIYSSVSGLYSATYVTVVNPVAGEEGGGGGITAFVEILHGLICALCSKLWLWLCTRGRPPLFGPTDASLVFGTPAACWL